jgi:predicted metalloenzyme YecM
MSEKDPKLAKIEFKQIVDQLRFKLSLSIQEFKIDHIFIRQFEDKYNQFSEINKYSNKRTELEVLKTLLTLLKVNSDFYNSGIVDVGLFQ